MSRTSTGSSSRPDDARAAVRAALAELKVRPARSLGQSFLVDPFIADAEAALTAAGPPPYLEVGPGLGALTDALRRRALLPLTLLERDRRLARRLRATLPGSIDVLDGDAEEFDFAPYGTVCGNLPFRVATPILLRAVRAGVPRVVALVQEEVAERVVAAPGTGEYGRLTLALAVHATAERFLPVPPESFEPVPQVAGRVVVLERKPQGPEVPDLEAFEELTRTLFGGRRKQLKNLLPRALPDGVDAPTIAARAGWPDDWGVRRPEEIPPEAYFRLARGLAALAPSRPPRSRGRGRGETRGATAR